MSRKVALGAVVAVAALFAGCTTPSATPVPEVSIPAPTETLQTAYDQRVEWTNCAEDNAVVEQTDGAAISKSYTCGTVSVPLDYNNPEGPTIDLKLVRYSTGTGKEPLVINPGGPGGGAINGLPSMVENLFPTELMQHYDIVAPDPRGVGLSTPVRCLSDEEIDEMRAGSADVETIAGIQTMAADFGAKCLENSPDMAQHSDSLSAAHDLDIIRAALAQEKLNYLGFSYGTFLGALYADEFPESVGRFVLDGAMDPAATIDDVSRAQAGGFEASLGHWIETEQNSNPNFPLRGDVDSAKANLKEWLDSLASNPLPTSDPDRPLTKSLALSAILAGMYSTQSYEYVSFGLGQAIYDRDGSILLQIADLYADREPDGTYSTNSNDAFNVINLLDYTASGTEAEWQQEADSLKAEFPTVGSEFGLASAMASAWPITAKDTRRTVTGSGAAPILVVGTTHDPATPYQWAEALASQLESATLLTWEGWSHCAYTKQGSSCIQAAVNKFLISGELPEEGTICSD
ncbi:MAG: alpha/beta hydrolase [Actinomycetaceae bacterium]|nr:alpha/beta hydrolase [Actinomycetaceae bacterium]